MTAAMEIVASHIAPEECLPELTRLAKDLTVALALHLADLVASFLTGVLAGQAVLLFGTKTRRHCSKPLIGFAQSSKNSCMSHHMDSKVLRWKHAVQEMGGQNCQWQNCLGC